MGRTRNAAAAVLAGALVATTAAAVGTSPPATAAAEVLNGRIAFDRLVEYTDAEGFPRRTGDVFSSEVDGGGRTNLTSSPGVDDIQPAWSPDGTRIAFSSNRDGNYDLWTMAADGSDLQQVTFTYGIEYDGGYVDLFSSFEPTWSPDGGELAFTAYRGASIQAEVYTVPVGQTEEGYTEVRVTDPGDSMSAASPDWSPDGTALVFTGYFDSFTTDIWTIGVDGTGASNLTGDAGTYVTDLDPAWSADGSRIVWVSNRDSTDPLGVETDVYVMRAAEPDVVARVTTDPDVEFDPEFSPDGTQVLYQRNYHDPEIWVVAAPADAARAAGPVRVGAGGAPSWAPSVQTPGTVSLTVSRVGRGAVASSPAGIACGRDCTERYAAGARVTLTAVPDPGRGFVGWSGACTGTGPCRVTMRQAKEVTATFAPAYTLTVVKVGRGRVTSTPAGIRCGQDCSEAYARGTLVTLVGEPGPTENFVGWSPACPGTVNGPCTVTVDRARTITATFRTG